MERETASLLKFNSPGKEELFSKNDPKSCKMNRSKSLTSLPIDPSEKLDESEIVTIKNLESSHADLQMSSYYYGNNGRSYIENASTIIIHARREI